MPNGARAKPPRSVPLLGPDVVLLALSTLGGGRPVSSNAAVVVELDAAVELARVESALTRFLAVCPWLGGRLVRPRPWGKLCWRVPWRGPTLPPIRTTRLDAPTALATLVDRELAAPIDPRREPPLRLTLAATATGTELVLTWAHPLMDPHGAEHLLRLLAETDEQGGGTPSWPIPPLLIAPRETRSLRERGALANRSVAHLKALAPDPPLSLAAAPQRAAPRGPRHWRFRFSAESKTPDRLRRGMPWRLAVVAKAMAALFRARGLALDVPFLVPVSTERRRRGAHGPVLGNYLAFHFARAFPPADDDTASLARALHDQLAEAVRKDELEAAWAGLSFARYRPLGALFRELPWTKAGEFCSFHFADTDALLPDRTRLFGAIVRGGYHVAAVPARPGAGVFFSRHGTVENVVVSTTDGVLDDTDATTIAGVVEREMGWRALPPDGVTAA